jgi:hypothetical protein
MKQFEAFSAALSRSGLEIARATPAPKAGAFTIVVIVHNEKIDEAETAVRAALQASNTGFDEVTRYACVPSPVLVVRGAQEIPAPATKGK